MFLVEKALSENCAVYEIITNKKNMDEFFSLCRPVSDKHNKKNSKEIYNKLCKVSCRTGYTDPEGE